ncbi:hypothetical protein EHS25_009964 [Saitozyma podzolica]|uniref:Programmed cell death protein 2 C-terminal domain-containing protein n=1 Tax=Saitozyma podzolica TaxID=1890683 RepID=A0A427YI79_9TREE|nr:hypothetical protein EHS25_009964 [Saitozyma podzolica]
MVPTSPSGSSVSLPDSNALLALPDGPIPNDSSDRKSHTISLIGGYATFPPGVTVPDINCGVCHSPVPLLAQRREGSVRAFRASVKNEEYVRDVQAKRAEREKREAEEREKAKVNPFSLSTEVQSDGNSLFGAATLFGSQANPLASPAPPTSAETPDIASLSLSSDTSVAGPSKTLSPPLPAYQPPQYLSTIAEYLPIPEDVEMDAADDDDETEEQKAEWRNERFESLLPRGMDPVFERFVRRIDSAEDGSTQVMRYDLGGVPLPYSSSSPLTKKLFPTLPPTKPDDEDPPYEEHYTAATVPACKACGGKRVFELQLVPSLISVLVPSSITTTGKEPEGTKEVKAMSEAERKEELAKLASGQEGGGEGMEWGTVMVFGCEKDCVGFREEWVGVEWEATLSNAR